MPERLGEVPGLKRSVIETIQQSVRDSRVLRDLTVNLTPFGVGQETVFNIFREFGDLAPALVESNPYLLIERVRGVGFKIADTIARAMGIAKTDPQRIRAGIFFVLDQSEFQRGDLYIDRGRAAEKMLLAARRRRQRRGCRPGKTARARRAVRRREIPETCILKPQNELIEKAAARRLFQLSQGFRPARRWRSISRPSLKNWPWS